MSVKEKLLRLNYKQHVDTYTKKINNWFISFVLNYYENACDEMVEEIVDYYISPAEIIDRNEISKDYRGELNVSLLHFNRD